MAEITDIVGYMFKGTVYCERHIIEAMTSTEDFAGWELASGIVMDTEENLDEIAAAFGVDRDKEYTFDSDDFPKRIYTWEVEEDLFCDTDFERLTD